MTDKIHEDKRAQSNITGGNMGVGKSLDAMLDELGVRLEGERKEKN